MTSRFDRFMITMAAIVISGTSFIVFVAASEPNDGFELVTLQTLQLGYECRENHKPVEDCWKERQKELQGRWSLGARVSKVAERAAPR